MNRIAAFVRNHRKHLEAAAELSDKDPSRLVTFRSAKLWRRVKEALDDQETVKLYFSPNGTDGLVEYEGTLKALVLNPEFGEQETDAALGWDLPDTQDEGLWEDNKSRVRTLYIVSNCRKLKHSFPMTELIKVTDSVPISANYGYSYVPVYERDLDGQDVEKNPDEVDDPKKYYEGAVHTVSVNAFERNSLARNKCIERYGCTCSVCDFNFEVFYGDIGTGFIHVHHLTPLAEVDSRYSVDPVQDLRPVCPNCHAMIHKRIPPFTLDEMKKIVNQNKNDS